MSPNGPSQELRTLLARVRVGWSCVRFENRCYGMTRTDLVAGRSIAIYAEELGGRDVVSTNLLLTTADIHLRPCEMPAAKVLAFLRGFATT